MKKLTLIAGFLSGTMALTAVGAAQAQDGGRKGGGERPAFGELDADGNGEVTVAEFEAHRAARFAEADTNGDGSLSEDEMTAAAEDRKNKRMQRHVTRMIERQDANGNGTIELDELGNSERGGERFAKLDTDGSGGVSEEEMEAAKGDRGGKRDRKRKNKG